MYCIILEILLEIWTDYRRKINLFRGGEGVITEPQEGIGSVYGLYIGKAVFLLRVSPGKLCFSPRVAKELDS